MPNCCVLWRWTSERRRKSSLRQCFFCRPNPHTCFNASNTSNTIGQVKVRSIIPIVRHENSGS